MPVSYRNQHHAEYDSRVQVALGVQRSQCVPLMLTSMMRTWELAAMGSGRDITGHGETSESKADTHDGACRWRRGLSALVCSPHPADLSMLTPPLMPRVQTPEFATKTHKCHCMYTQMHHNLSCTVMQAGQTCMTCKDEAQVQSIAACVQSMCAKIKHPCCYSS